MNCLKSLTICIVLISLLTPSLSWGTRPVCFTYSILLQRSFHKQPLAEITLPNGGQAGRKRKGRIIGREFLPEIGSTYLLVTDEGEKIRFQATDLLDLNLGLELTGRTPSSGFAYLSELRERGKSFEVDGLYGHVVDIWRDSSGQEFFTLRDHKTGVLVKLSTQNIEKRVNTTSAIPPKIHQLLIQALVEGKSIELRKDSMGSNLSFRHQKLKTFSPEFLMRVISLKIDHELVDYSKLDFDPNQMIQQAHPQLLHLLPFIEAMYRSEKISFQKEKNQERTIASISTVSIRTFEGSYVNANGRKVSIDSIDQQSIQRIPKDDRTDEAPISISQKLKDSGFLGLKHVVGGHGGDSSLNFLKILAKKELTFPSPAVNSVGAEGVYLQLSKTPVSMDLGITLTFDLELLDSTNNYHFNPSWSFGVPTINNGFPENSIDPTLFSGDESLLQNEFVFRSSVDLRFLKQISVPMGIKKYLLQKIRELGLNPPPHKSWDQLIVERES